MKLTGYKCSIKQFTQRLNLNQIRRWVWMKKFLKCKIASEPGLYKYFFSNYFKIIYFNSRYYIIHRTAEIFRKNLPSFDFYLISITNAQGEILTEVSRNPDGKLVLFVYLFIYQSVLTF